MFESTNQTSSSREVERWWASVFLSMVLHLLVVTVIVFVPLWLIDVLPEGDLLTILIAPPPPPAPLLPAPPSGPDRSTRRPEISINLGDSTPGRVPERILPPEDKWAPHGISGITNSGASVVGPIGPAPGAGGVGPFIPAPTPLPPPPKPRKREPVRISSGVQESKLIRRVAPVYSELARRARISGVVILQVSVDEEGNIADIKILRGHPLLNEEAERAVAQWKYSPTLLNGEPVPVTATVTVIFKLNDR